MILDRFARGLGSSESRDFTLQQASAEALAVFGGAPTYSGAQVTVENALGLIPVFSAVRALAEALHVMPCHVYRRLDRGREKATDTWQYRLFHEAPNSEMAPGQFFETLMVHLNLWGDSFSEKVDYSFAGSRRVGEIWPILPSRVNVERRKSDGAKIFTIDGESRTFTEDKILHIPALGYDGLRGLSPIAMARQEIGVAMSRQQYRGNMYAKGPGLGGVIERPAEAPKWSPEAQLAFKTRWQTIYEGAAGAGGTPVLEDGMKFSRVGMPLTDQQFVQQEQLTTGQIANLFRVPASMIGGSTGDSLTYGNREQDAIQFVTFSLLPWMTRISQGLWRDNDLFPSRTFYPAFLPEALMQGDHASRAAFYTALSNLKVLTPNDIAEMEDRPVRPGGDEFITAQAPTGGNSENEAG